MLWLPGGSSADCLPARGRRVEGASVAPGDWVKLYGSPVTWVELARRPESAVCPVTYTPGLRTLKHLLSAALQPVGSTLYVYGGGWNWQDNGPSRQAMDRGVPASWHTFFREMGPNYCYRREQGGPDWYPCGNYNQYYYAGADCSGYLGWVLRQVLGPGSFVSPAQSMARRLAERWRLGTWSRPAGRGACFRPGDIVSIRGHVWLCLGACEDGQLGDPPCYSIPQPYRLSRRRCSALRAGQKSKLPGAGLGPAVYGEVPSLEPAL